MIGLGWGVNRYDGSEEFDLDASAFLLGANGRVTSDADFIFYGNQKHHSSCIESTGDNRSGAGDGDDEQLIVNLSLVPSNIEKIAFVVTIYDAETRRQNFGMVNNAYIRVLDQNSNQEIVRFTIGILPADDKPCRLRKHSLTPITTGPGLSFLYRKGWQSHRNGCRPDD